MKRINLSEYNSNLGILIDVKHPLDYKDDLLFHCATCAYPDCQVLYRYQDPMGQKHAYEGVLLVSQYPEAKYHRFWIPCR